MFGDLHLAERSNPQGFANSVAAQRVGISSSSLHLVPKSQPEHIILFCEQKRKLTEAIISSWIWKTTIHWCHSKVGSRRLNQVRFRLRLNKHTARLNSLRGEAGRGTRIPAANSSSCFPKTIGTQLACKERSWSGAPHPHPTHTAHPNR